MSSHARKGQPKRVSMARDEVRSQVHQGHRERLPARLLEDGLDSFQDHQVLEPLLFHVIPRGDTNPIAHRLVRRFGSLSAVLEADPKDIASVDGVGIRAATFLSLIPQLTRRYFHDRVTRENPRLVGRQRPIPAQPIRTAGISRRRRVAAPWPILGSVEHPCPHRVEDDVTGQLLQGRICKEGIGLFTGAGPTSSQGLGQQEFVGNFLVYDATLRNLELIGEAATNTLDDVRSANPQNPWRLVIVTRHRLIHAYLGIEDDTVWSIIQDDVPALLKSLRRMRENLSSPGP